MAMKNNRWYTSEESITRKYSWLYKIDPNHDPNTQGHERMFALTLLY